MDNQFTFMPHEVFDLDLGGQYGPDYPISRKVICSGQNKELEDMFERIIPY